MLKINLLVTGIERVWFVNYILPINDIYIKLVSVAALVVEFKFPVGVAVAIYVVVLLLPIIVFTVGVIHCVYHHRHSNRYGITRSLDN